MSDVEEVRWTSGEEDRDWSAVTLPDDESSGLPIAAHGRENDDDAKYVVWPDSCQGSCGVAGSDTVMGVGGKGSIVARNDTSMVVRG